MEQAEGNEAEPHRDHPGEWNVALRRALARAAASLRTIRGRILVAFTVMTLITGALAGYAIMGDPGRRRPGAQDLRRIADVDQLRARGGGRLRLHARRLRAPLDRRRSADARCKLDLEIAKLAETLKEDLDVAVQRSQSRRAREGGRARRGCGQYVAAAPACICSTTPGSMSSWEKLDSYAAQGQRPDRPADQLHRGRRLHLSPVGARDGRARHPSSTSRGAVLALLLSGLVAWALARRIIRPVAAASSVAERIATGRLDVVIPAGRPRRARRPARRRCG